MHRPFAIVLLIALLALPASAARRRSVAPVISDTLSIVFVDAPETGSTLTATGGDAWLDVNDVAHQAGSRHKDTRLQRRIGIRLVRRSGAVSGTATISARIETSDGRTSMRLDGKPLTDAPIVIDAHAVIGAVAFHTLEILISDAVAPGPIAAAITWEVTAQ
jgi:hypothetical protein